MPELSKFLNETHPEPHRSLGVFYPFHNLVAVVDNMTAAQHIRRVLLHSGLREEDVICIEGQELIDLENKETGLAGFLLQKLSRSLGCEQVAADNQLEFARQGKALVFAHCPSEKAKLSAWHSLEHESLIAAHYYGSHALDHLRCTGGTH